MAYTIVEVPAGPSDNRHAIDIFEGTFILDYIKSHYDLHPSNNAAELFRSLEGTQFQLEDHRPFLQCVPVSLLYPFREQIFRWLTLEVPSHSCNKVDLGIWFQEQLHYAHHEFLSIFPPLLFGRAQQFVQDQALDFQTVHVLKLHRDFSQLLHLKSLLEVWNPPIQGDWCLHIEWMGLIASQFLQFLDLYLVPRVSLIFHPPQGRDEIKLLLEWASSQSTMPHCCLERVVMFDIIMSLDPDEIQERSEERSKVLLYLSVGQLLMRSGVSFSLTLQGEAEIVSDSGSD